MCFNLKFHLLYKEFRWEFNVISFCDRGHTLNKSLKGHFNQSATMIFQLLQ
jgi:hypothetical protein